MPEIEYAMGREPLERLLTSIDRPGDFCVHGRTFAPMPMLTVERVGLLSFPVPDSQVRALIEAADRTPYGKGAETLVDTGVRDSWQIDACRIGLGGRAWTGTFATIMDAVAEGLGCPAERLEARPYKLLIYEPGGFFAAHRDSEKADGMVGTLSISFPAVSKGIGGDLVVRHGGREMRADMSVSEPSELAWAAFYADCAHEIEPVREGYRLSLVFQLCLRAGAADTPWHAPDYSDLIDLVARELAAWRDTAERPTKLVWLLEHDYSEAGLSFASLKNADAALWRVLERAAERAGWALFAAVVHIEEIGDADFSGIGAYGGWNRYDDEMEDLEMGEVFDASHWLDGWADPEGDRPAFGPISLRGGELLPEGALDDAAPDNQWLNEATGNEGITVERVYRRAALVLWPVRDTLGVLAGSSIDAAVAWLERQCVRSDASARDEIGSLIGLWGQAARPGQDGSARTGMCRLLAGTGDGTLALRFLREVMLTRFDGAGIDELPAAIRLLSADEAGEWLSALVGSAFAERPDEVSALLLRVGELPGFGRTPTAGARTALATLPSTFETARTLAIDAWPLRPPAGSDRDAGLRALFTVAWRCGLEREMEAAVEALAARQVPDFAERRIMAVLDRLGREEGFVGSAARRALWRAAADALLARSANPPEPPRDWVMEASVPCDCELCLELKAFCRDPVESVRRFPLRKELRRHLHRQIDACKLDMSHETVRRGSPYTLVCTKTRASYRRRLAEYAGDVTCMKALAISVPAETDDGERANRLRAAARAAE